MKKYSNKKELTKRWTEKISSQKYYFDLLKKSGQATGNFYDSEIYSELKKRKNRAEYRYDNRAEISEKRKEISMILVKVITCLK